jgi:endonuclease/exonuclease/phosphatase family metal-dependent hydrolase
LRFYDTQKPSTVQRRRYLFSMLPVLAMLATTPAATLTLTSLNLWGVPDIAHLKYPNQRRLNGPIQSFLRQSFADVVVVQELWRGFDRGNHVLGALGIQRFSEQADSGLGAGVFGKAWRRVSMKNHSFTAKARGMDALKKKGLGWMVVESLESALQVVVVNTHLQAETAFRPEQDAVVRQKQLGETLDLLRGEERPVVWVGDFNLSEKRFAADAASVTMLEQAGFKEAAAFSGIQAEATHANGSRYDRLWVRASKDWQALPSSLTVHNEAENRLQLSDHFPLTATIAFNPKSPPAPKY